jgi:hypothetical protein
MFWVGGGRRGARNEPIQTGYGPRDAVLLGFTATLIYVYIPCLERIIRNEYSGNGLGSSGRGQIETFREEVIF